MRGAQPGRTSAKLLTAAILVLFLVSAVIFWNVNGLRRAIEHRTQSYLKDVSQQTAQLIDSRLHAATRALHLLAEGVARLDEEEAQDYLRESTKALSFSRVSLVNLQGEILSPDGPGEYLGDWDAFAGAVQGQDTCSVQEDELCYMVPVYEGDTVVGVLAGIMAMDDMQALLDNNCFDDRGSVCILDREGHRVASPTVRPFSSLIAETQYTGEEEWAVKMRSDLRTGQMGSVVLPTASGTDILLDYRPLSVYGWSIATLLPRDILAADVDPFLNRTFGIIFALMAAVLVLFITTVVNQGRYRARLERAAFVDPVTQGPSNIRFRLLAADILRRNPAEHWAVVSLNIKRFKVINDLGGSALGDAVLRRTYQVLRESLADPAELAVRGEADTFYLLLRQEGPPEALGKRLEELARRLENIPNPVGALRVSQGVYPVPAGETDLIAAQDRANAALNSVRTGYHSTCTFYDEQIRARQREEVALLGELELAFQRQEFIIYLQPKVRLSDGAVAGAEALVRWKRPNHGVVGPGVFISLCEKNGLVCRLDLCVFEQTCRFLQARAEAGRPIIPISVNLSRQHLKDAGFLDEYLKIMRRYGVEAGWIQFELTESIMFSNDEILQATEIVRHIQSWGFQCSLDDFGSGYSALGLLKALPINCLKLDRQFFVDNFESPRAKAVIQSVIQLAARLQIETVAEGVEEANQVAFLREVGCDMVQGYYFSKPLPVDEFQVLADQRPSPFAPGGGESAADRI